MKAFTIDVDNNITFHASAKAAPKTEGTEVFTSEKTLGELATAWPASLLVEIFNSLTGVTPVKKFTSRTLGIARIWKEIQKLGGPEAEATATDAPAAEPKAARNAKTPKPAKAPKSAKPAKTPKAAGTSKKDTILALISRKNGATLEEIMEATGWQKPQWARPRRSNRPKANPARGRTKRSSAPSAVRQADPSRVGFSRCGPTLPRFLPSLFPPLLAHVRPSLFIDPTHYSRIPPSTPHPCPLRRWRRRFRRGRVLRRAAGTWGMLNRFHSIYGIQYPDGWFTLNLACLK
jgi:hypothetical protein